MGADDDLLNVFDLANLTQELDISGIVEFDGGTGFDTANFTNLNASYIEAASSTATSIAGRR